VAPLPGFAERSPFWRSQAALVEIRLLRGEGATNSSAILVAMTAMGVQFGLGVEPSNSWAERGVWVLTN